MKYKIFILTTLTLVLFQTSLVLAQGTGGTQTANGGGTQTTNECNDKKDNDSDGFIDSGGGILGTTGGIEVAADPECKGNPLAVCETGETKAPCPKSGSGTGSGSGSGTGSGSGATTNSSTSFPLNVSITNPLKVDTIQGAIQLFMSAVLRVALPFIVVFFIWSGLSFVLARGNPDKIKVAKNMFLYTVVGTLLILGAWVITNAIIGTVNSITS